MNFLTSKYKTCRRRAISQIVGSLFMLAIVVPIGSVILSQGLFEVTDFNRFLAVTREQGIDEVQEAIVFEHIRFEPTGKQVTISVRNISLVESSIDRVTIVKIDTQELLVYDVDQSTTLPLKDAQDITVIANSLPSQWNDPNYKDGNYKISLTTVRGNFFDTIARPFNT